MLSDELDLLPYPQRIPALLELLRRRPDPEARTAELATGGPYERFLAVTAAAALGFRPIVVQALQDPDPAVRAEAVRQALRAGWTTGGDLLADAPPVLRHLILRLLRKRPGSGDAVIDLVRERYGDREAAVLLPACTTATVSRLLPGLARSLVSWKVLARRHSAAVLDWAHAGLAATPEPDWPAFTAAVGACSRTEPARVLDLLERHTAGTLPDIDLTPLAARFPARTAALVITMDPTAHRLRHLHSRVLPHLVSLGVDDLAALTAINPDLLALLPPARRAEVYAAVPQTDEPWARHIESLPEPLRTREVRRVLALPHVAAAPHRTRRWRLYLPAAEALPILDEEVHDDEPRERASAYTSMVDVARREPAAVPQVLGRLRRVRNERDAVRRVVVEALRTLIPHFTGADAAALTAITDAAIEARDLSARTRDQLVELAWAALAARPAGDPGDESADWALGMIARLPIPYYLETPLRRGQERLVTAALRKRLAVDTAVLFDLVDLLETRARQVPELQELLRRAAGPSSPADVRARAVQLWLDDPRTRAARAAELLREDPSAARLAPVWREISGWSTTLLDTVLHDPTLIGPPAHVRRWTPRQQRAYAATLAGVAADTEAEPVARTTAVKSLARVPVAGRELLAAFLDAPETPVAEAALGALPWTDRPDEALPVLLGHAGGDRALVALSAADRASRFVNASALAGVLREVLLAPSSSPVRVSSRKAAIRILARYGPPDVAHLFVDVWHTPGTHPDVRAAVVTALRGRTPSPDAWSVLADAARSTAPAEVRALLAAGPQDLREADRPGYASLVVSACTRPHPRVAVEAYRALSSWIPWAPEAIAVIVDVLAERIDSPVFWHAELRRSLVAALLDRPGAEGRAALAQIFERLVEQDRRDPGPGTPDRDHPARRYLTRIVEDVVQWVQNHRTGDPQPIREAARSLAAEPAFLADGADLLRALAGPDADALAEVADLVADRPVLAARLAEQIAGGRTVAARLDDIPATARRLGERGDLPGGLFALALVAAAGQAKRWDEPWPDELRRLRAHPQPEVADAAYRRAMVR
ncbi:HEAT repeat domain-containing protein [Actinoplanes sp. CA-252034]|uniref:HEAT repeat domain-containing protein n=1 Tax=Actinoplanes sp. CA-252034 TaxID=3239906 RepID=UPI003D97C973